MASTIWALLESRVAVKVSIWSSTERTSSSRPVTALLSSWVMVLSWATPPPLRIRLSAPSTSSISGLRPLRSRGITSPSLSVPSAPVSGGAQRDELLAEQAGLADLGEGVLRELGVVAQLERDVGVVAVELDRLHLADADVVDLDRRLRDQVEDVLELDGHGDRVVADVGAAGQRQGVDVEVAAGQHHAADQQRRGTGGPGGSGALTLATSTRPPRVGSNAWPYDVPVPSGEAPRKRRRALEHRAGQVAQLPALVGLAEEAAEPAWPGRTVIWLTSSPRLALVSRVPACGL